MKLYTKEMFLIAAEKCEVSMIDAEHIMNYIDEYVTPIELPSDEEIKQSAKDYHYNNGVYYGQVKAFIDSAKWVIDNIKNQQQ